MKIEIKPTIGSLLKQLPPDTYTDGDKARMDLTRDFIMALCGELPDGLVANVFHDAASRALAEGINDALRDIIRAALPKVDGRRRPAEAAQALNAAQTFKGRTAALKAALTAYKKVLGNVPGIHGGAEAIGKFMRPAYVPVRKAFDALLACPAPSDEAQDTLDEMQALCASTEKAIEMYATVEFAPGSITKSDGPSTSLSLANWITACGTLATQTAEAIRGLKTPG